MLCAEGEAAAIPKEVREMRVGITGHKGFLGSHVQDAMAEAGHDVKGFDLPEHDILALPDGAFKGLDAVCHIAAIGDVYHAHRDPDLAVRVNVLGTQRVLQQALDDGVARVVYCSTWEVDTNLDHPYNITKYGGDLMAQCYRRLYGLDTIILRLGTLYGPRMRETAVIPKFIKLAAEGKRITIQGDGRQYRQFLHVRDAGRAFVAALTTAPVTGDTAFRVVGDETTTIRQIAELSAGEIEFLPARAGDAQAMLMDNSEAKAALNWTPQIPFAEGFAELQALLTPVPAGVA